MDHLVLFDKVMVEASLSYTGGDVEHGTKPPVGYAQLAIYDTIPAFNTDVSCKRRASGQPRD